MPKYILVVKFKHQEKLELHLVATWVFFCFIFVLTSANIANLLPDRIWSMNSVVFLSHAVLQ